MNADTRTGLAALLCAALLMFTVWWAAAARADPPYTTNPMDESLGAHSNSDGWCYPVTSTQVDLLSVRPARVTTAILGEVRHITVTHGDTTDTGSPVCVALGDDGVGSAISCDPENVTSDDNTAEPLFTVGQSVTLRPLRTKEAGGTTGALPALYAEALATKTIATCVTLYW